MKVVNLFFFHFLFSLQHQNKLYLFSDIKNVDIRGITVGSTIRRLAVEVGSKTVVQTLEKS